MGNTPDFRVLFESVPALIMALAPDSPRFTILAASDAYLHATMLRREDMVGRPVFEVFPENPDAPSGAEANSRASFERVLRLRFPDVQPVQQHDIRRPESEGGGFDTRFWSPVNTPVLDEKGGVRYILHRVEDVTDLVLAKQQVERGEEDQDRRAREIALMRREADASREREERYVALFEKVPLGLALVRTPAGTIAEVNDAFLALFEATREDVTGRTPAACGVLDPERQAELFAELREKGVVRNADVVRGADNGEPRRLSLNLDWVGIGGERLILATVEDVTERLTTREALEVSERRYRELFEGMRESLFAVEIIANEEGEPIDWRYIETNPQLERFIGMTREQLVGHTYTEVVPRPDKGWIDMLGRVAMTGEPMFEERFAPTLGRWLSLYAYSPRKSQAAVLFTDITERKQAEQAMQRSEARLRAAINSMVDEVWFTDEQGNIILTNDAAMRNLGFEKSDEFFRNIGQALSALEVLEPDGTPLSPDRAPLPRALKGETLQNNGEMIRNLRTGELRYREVNSAPVRGEGGKIVGAVAVARDVTERKKVEFALRVSEERYRALFTSIDEGFCIIQVLFDSENRPVDYVFVAVNPAFEKQTGIRNAIGRRMREISPEHEEHWFQIYGKVALTGESVRFQEHARALGRDFDVYAFRIGGALDRLVAILFSDITERKKNEEELKRAATVFNSSSEAIVITDADTHIVAVNPAFEAITGYRQNEVIGKNPNILKSGHHDDAFYKNFWRSLNTTGSWKGELWNRSKKGDIFVVLTAINTTYHRDGSVQNRIAVITDITEKKRSEEVIWQQANYDALTGLPNRRLFLDHLQQEIRKARRTRTSVALMFMDLDGFKSVNDVLGHEAGDMLLIETGRRLQACVRETDTVARLGGDEFTVILTGLTSLRQVSKVAQDILRRVAEPYEIGGEVVYVSGSLGITLFPQDAPGMDELLINADHAMYAAKAAGKNRYSFFTEAMQQAAQERMWLAHELRNALEKRQLRLAYQPIVELASGCINKAEALVRWDHPERGPIAPDVFIPVAEETGIIREIGDWVFFEAANQVAKWRKAYHPDFQISVNKSPIQFKVRGGGVSSLLLHLKELNLPGQSIAIEITEGVLMDESETVSDQLYALRDAGIEVSLDDFGTGYSTLSYLKRFDIDRIKIDKVFVRDLETDPDDLALCEAIIVMGHKLGIKVIAEGVENSKQQDILADAGCDFVQGYLLSGPVSPEEMEGLLARSSGFCSGSLPG